MSVDSQPTSIAAELEKSRRDVLDLSLRNPLLNFRPSKRRGLQVVDEVSRELFRLLVGGERVMYFLPAPEPVGADSADDTSASPDLFPLPAEPTPEPNTSATRHTDNRLQTALTRERLDLCLRETFRQARLSIQETGVNILYLGLGMLRWYASDSSSTARRAPLVLIPVQLTRSDVRENFKLSWTKDEIEQNLSLEAKLKQDFNVRLPEMASEEDIDIDDYLDRVERAVVKQPRWLLERNEIHLSFFSFSKLLIYKDLDPTSWPPSSQPAAHPLVRQLYGSDGFAYEPSEFGEDSHLDRDLGDAGMHPVVDADSSQTLAVLDAVDGNNLVIQGPPGTGKSQTITNLIGEAIARDKTVLFVAEKMAALEVVKRRLDTVHLGDACLELHSHKTNKRAVLDELRRTLSLGRPEADGDVEDRVLLEDSRTRLNEYARAVNTPVAESEFTPNELVGRLARLKTNGLIVKDQGLPIRGSASWNAQDFTLRRALVREIQDFVAAIGTPRRHLWWACGLLQFSPTTDSHTLHETVEAASSAVSRLQRRSDALREALCYDLELLTREDLERTIRVVPWVAEAPLLLGADHRHAAWTSEAGRIIGVAGAARRYATTRSRYDAVLSRADSSLVAHSELDTHELVRRLATLKANGLVVEDRSLSIRRSASWSAGDFTRRRALVEEIQELVASIGSPHRHRWWPCGRLLFSREDSHTLRKRVAETCSALRRLQRRSDALRKALCFDLALRDLKREDLEKTIRVVPWVAGAPALLGADHRQAAWRSEAGRITEVASAARRYATIRSRFDAVLMEEAWDRELLAARQALRAYGRKWWRFLRPTFRNARRTIQDLCRVEAPGAVEDQIELIDAVLEVQRLSRGIAESSDLVERLFPTLILGEGSEAHGNLADAADWLVRLHQAESAGLVDSHIHDLLDCRSDGAELADPKAPADACEDALEVLWSALRSLTAAMELRSDRVEGGAGLEELSFGELDAWLWDAHDRVDSVQDVVRFNQLERRAAEAGLAEVAEAAASREDAARQLTGLFEHGCYSAWLALAFGSASQVEGQQNELVDDHLEIRRLRRDIAESSDLVERLFPTLTLGEDSEAHGNLADAAEWLVRLHRAESARFVDPHIHDLLDCRSDGAGLADPKALADACEDALEMLGDALRSLTAAMELRPDRVEAGAGLEELPFGELDTWLRNAHDRVDSVQDIVRFNQLERRAAEAGLAEVAAAAASREDAARQLTGLFEHWCYSTWLDLAFSERPTLGEFDGATHTGVLERFRRLDKAQFHHNQALIAERHWQHLPRHDGGGQLGILRREFQKRTRYKPVRVLMMEAGRAIQRIKPVFMMSPLSIAKYIPPGSVSFDLVVFDEASQVRPVEALGAIVRGKQSVVVGDDKQLPPTSFFDRMADEGDEERSQTTDLESILGMFCAQGAGERMLRWHYRSRHESLIAVSNHEFYDNRLVVFPSPRLGKTNAGLVLHHDPETRYARRHGNRAEAKTVAQAAVEHARSTPHLTLGVVAFSNVQARRIEDELDILRRSDPSFEDFFAGNPEEPFFVKNLENVQGDERDVILISIGYGKIDGTYMPMNFGPLNQIGGERRLNVLITRARQRCVVYSNFLAADLDLRRSRARGVEALKTFLEYAQTGQIGSPRPTGRGADSPFEEAVAEGLRKRGFEIDHQVGSAGYFIDLAVRSPSQPGSYVLGVECDGATYHSARSARDRDRLRQERLEDMGWTIHRIWSTDWFRRPDVELDKAEKAIETAHTCDVKAAPYSASDAGGSTTPLPRTPGPEVEAVSPTVPYMVAKLEATPGATLHETPARLLARWIERVVTVESPVHFDEVTRRIRTAFGVGQAGSRIRAQIRSAVGVGVGEGLYRLDERQFLWRWDHGPLRCNVEVRRRDRDLHTSLRKSEMIAHEEIGAALIHAVRVSYGITKEDAVREAIRLFGIRRAGASFAKRFRQVLDKLVEDGALVRDGGFLQLPEDSS